MSFGPRARRSGRENTFCCTIDGRFSLEGNLEVLLSHHAFTVAGSSAGSCVRRRPMVPHGNTCRYWNLFPAGSSGWLAFKNFEHCGLTSIEAPWLQEG
jgi:hypothetical protein